MNERIVSFLKTNEKNERFKIVSDCLHFMNQSVRSIVQLENKRNKWKINKTYENERTTGKNELNER